MKENSDSSTPQPNYWIFQAKPEVYDLDKFLQPGEMVEWRIRNHSKEIKRGDIVCFWQAGDRRGIYGWGEMVKEPHPDESKPLKKGEKQLYFAPAEFRVRFAAPVLAAELQNHLILKDLLILRNAVGASFKMTVDEATALARLISGKNEEFWYTPEQTDTYLNTFLSDSPETNDFLGRNGFAKGLCKLMDLVYSGDPHKKTKRNGCKRDESNKSFILHLGGPWGSGKSTIMYLMQKAIHSRKHLKEKSTDGEIIDLKHEWLTVWFNAWRQQHIKPVCWPLMDQIFKQSVCEYGSSEPWFKRKLKTFWLRVKEKTWRLTTGNVYYYVVFGISLAFSILMLIWFISNHNNDIKTNVDILGGLSGLLGAIWSAGRLLKESLLEGSSEAAVNFMKKSKDPIHRLRDHFAATIDRLNKPILVFIDDIDRCRPEYVVELMENIQTIFNHNSLFFVIAGDRRWIYTCFENKYTEFSDIVREPGKRLGYLFLEKAIQVSVSVPIMDKINQTRYLDTLHNKELDLSQQTFEQTAVEAASELENAGSDEEIGQILINVENDPAKRIAYINKALELSISEKEILKTTLYFLRKFSHLLEANPRAIKRYVNAYSIHKLAALSLDPEIIVQENLRNQYTLWLIILLRWPELAELLEKEPNNFIKLNQVPFVGIDGKFDEWAPFQQNPDVLNVIQGKDLEGVHLDEPVIRRFRSINPLAYVGNAD